MINPAIKSNYASSYTISLLHSLDEQSKNEVLSDRTHR